MLKNNKCICSWCSGEGLHQERVITFNRKEDAEEVVVSVDHETGKISDQSVRLLGLAIYEGN